ncbi:Dihydroorotate dehydrogenase [Mycena indigotica]|uniref:Dihydroorotate dehydrogenase (quinone), mitochondrial n=1 Tax=Mycena indigotica TaxID=2126181 RepID=A0A8H6T3N8_9AGAR|nr:Dihydroorotate dehydrogenase [Mycena indigotica]KAF7309757.1 Dihydroorotate dehydrogenase [Mycena indigotica]
MFRHSRLAQSLRPGFARHASTRAPSPSSPIRNGVYGTVLVVSAGLFTIYYLDARSAIHRYVFTPLLRNAFDAETGHKLAVRILKTGLAPRDPVVDDARLKSSLWDCEFSNPVGLAAGFDKNGEAIDGLFNLGFSWVEIGSVTPKPQSGNPQPRVFHLPDDLALINRYGFPSEGHAAVLSRLRARIPRFSDDSSSASFRPGSVLAVNLGKNKESHPDSIEDFVAGVKMFGEYSDVLVINVSSPNTPGLRGLQNRQALENLLAGVIEAREQISTRKPKLVLKIAPDLTESQLVEMASVIASKAIDAVIVSNTTTQRPASLGDLNKSEIGGLSGAPLKPYSLAALKTLRQNLPATIPLIGCGGISTGADALEYARAGASLIQVYTGFGYDGVGTCRRIKDELAGELEKQGTTWSEVVQKAVSELSLQETQKAADGTSRIKELIAEAEELRRMLDRLGESTHLEIA